MGKGRTTLILAVAAALLVTAYAQAGMITLDFEGLEHGRIVHDQFVSLGVLISADNAEPGHPDEAIAFDTSILAGDTTDDDLLGPPWSTGNLSAGELASLEIGTVLVIAENDVGGGDGVVDDPDDEGARPAGKLIFELARPANAVGFHLLDVESTTEENGNFMTFFNGGAALGTIWWTDLESGPLSQGVLFGNNSLNRIAPIPVAPFDRLEIHMGGSGAIDNVVFLVPAPSVPLLMWLGLLTLGLSRRKRS